MNLEEIVNGPKLETNEFEIEQQLDRKFVLHHKKVTLLLLLTY